jgi:alpha-N-arabinofuranosidase
MKNLYKYFICKRLFVFVLILPVTLLNIQSGVAREKAKKSINPIIRGYNADPSICRVNDNYFLVTSSSEYFPGIPIYQSKDLVNWKMIGHVLNRPSQLNLESVDCTKGVFAPTIRYNNGLFYVVSTLTGVPAGRPAGNFIVTAENPAGPWSDPVWLPEAQGIDPSLFFDDNGKVYYQGNYSPQPKKWNNHRNLWIQEFDVKSMKLIGKKVDIIEGSDFYQKGNIDGGIKEGVDFFEAPHLYKKDGKYYLIAGHGGTFQNHAVSVWRSDHVFGPYEMNPANPILTHRDLPANHTITSTGHADLVQTQTGEWWMVYLARRPYGGDIHILGRETFLSPVDWSGAWPIVNRNGNTGRAELSVQRPNLKEKKWNSEMVKDEFKGKTLDPCWTFIRTPHSNWWSLTDRKGFLRVQLRPEMISEIVNPSFIGRRQESPNCSATVKMEFVPASGMEEAGLVVERDKDNYFRFTLGNEAGRTVLRLFQRSGAKKEDILLAKSDVNSGSIYLKISSEGVYYTFSYSANGKDWILLKGKMDGSFLGMPHAGRFTGTFIGMYASSNGIESQNHADFDWFEYINEI